jgi:hypothetical protein
MAETDRPGSTIAVDRGAWSHLSPEHAALVAPPIIVSSQPVSTESVSTESVSTEPAATGPVIAPLIAVEVAAETLRLAQQARSRANMPVERHRRPTR